VKNRTSTEAKAGVSLEAARDIEVALFAKPGWHSAPGLEKERMGISALRNGLSNVYCAHIRTEFPIFNQQTRSILKQKRIDLSNLGPARSTLNDQRDYLKTIVSTYQKPKLKCLGEDFRSASKMGTDVTVLHRRLAKQEKIMLRDSLNTTGAKWMFQTATTEQDISSDTAVSAPFSDKTVNIYTWINHRYQSTRIFYHSRTGAIPPRRKVV